MQNEQFKSNNEILWAHIFTDTIKSSLWLKNQSFSPGRAAAGYPMLYVIYRILQNVKPRKVLEFGLGQSSKLSIQYAMAYPDVSLNIIEQSKDWLDFFANEMPDVSSFATLLTVDSVPCGNDLYTNHYKDLMDVIKDNKYDFIIIDGPVGSQWKSRSQIIEIAENDLLADSFIILMDDYERKGEKQTINALLDVLCEKKIPYTTGVYSGKKDTIVICSTDNSFVTTL